MNLGQAVAVCLYEIARRPAGAAVRGKSKTAPTGSLERITQELLEGLRVSGYLKAERSSVSDAKVRRLVRRFGLQAEDAEVLLGMLKQMLWKMRKS
jgi:tRNA/rRNA methyltransferase